MRGALFKRLGYQYSCDRKYLAKARISVSFVCHIHGVRYSLFIHETDIERQYRV